MANGDQDMATDKLMETEGMKVIAVDDDPVYLRILTQTLRRCGYEVTASCASPADALKEVEKNPDGVDFIMTVALTRGRGMDGFGLLKRIGERYPVVIMFSGEESFETRRRGTQGGACYLVEKPMCTWQIYIIWQHVLRWRREKAAGVVSANANPRPSQSVHLEDTPRKRGPGVNDSGKGKRASDGGTKATKKKKFEWTPKMHELFVNAVTQLKQTGDDTPNNIREFLEIDGIYVTTAQVSSHLQKYRRDCRTGGISTMPRSRPSHSNSTSNNYLESQESGGSYRFYTRSQGARDINQTSWLSGSASPVNYDVLGNGNHTTNLGGGAAYGHGYHHGNGIGDINGYDHHYGTINANYYDHHSGNGNNKSYGYPYGNSNDNNYGNGNGGCGGVISSGSMVSASLPSNLAPPVQHGRDGDASASQTSAVQPQNLDNVFSNWENTSSETAGTSGGGGVVTDGTIHGLTNEEFENLMKQ